MTPNGGSIVRSPTPGPRCSSMPITAMRGKPIEGAEVDIWHSSPEGFYENQDPIQSDMNLRGKFITDSEGHIGFRSVKPAGYPIPIDGPVGDLLRAQGRHNIARRICISWPSSPATRHSSRKSIRLTTSTSTATCSSASPDICWAILSVTTTGRHRRPT